MLRKFVLPLSIIGFNAMNAFAAPSTQTIIAPQCLLQKSNHHFTIIAQEKDLALISATQADINRLIKAKTLHNGAICGGFKDVSHEWNLSRGHADAHQFLSTQLTLNSITPIRHTAYTIRYEKEVNALLNTFNPQNMWQDLTTLTNFRDRYADSETGVAAAMWFKDQIEQIAKNSGHDDVTVYTVATGTDFKQPSVVVKIGNQNIPGIVIGGHMDTLQAMNFPKPGADDDGSGAVTVLETARVLLNSGLHFKKPIYIVWYSAEEEGLVGSGYVVRDFMTRNIKVDAVLQLDMTGYAYKNDPTVWLFKDYVNADLTAYLEKLINNYVKQPVKYSACGYACSDHASWTEKGIPSAFPFEAEMDHDNPDIHSSHDTMDKLSLDHMNSYAKLAIAFAVELAEPTH